MKLNLKVRAKNYTFWIAFIPAVLLVIRTVLAVFGYDVNIDNLQDNLLAVVEAVFAVLIALGVVVDHTTEGISDSDRAMTFDKPYTDSEEE